jgi:glycosyltransferase involved in cell wall biosynthesis
VRVVFYARPSLFDTGLSLARALSQRTELHLLLEIAPESWQQGAFDVQMLDLPEGIVDGAALAKSFPPALQAYWQDVAEFNLVVHKSRRSIHPATWRVSQQAMHHMRALRPDVVHFDDASLRLGWAAGGLRRQVPVIFSVHDPEPHTGESEWRTNLAYWLTLRYGTRFIVHSNALRSTFARRFGIDASKVDLVQLGAYDLYRVWAQPAVQKSRPTVLFFGRISPYKGLDVLYRAAPMVADAVPGVRIVVAGRPIVGYAPPDPPVLSNGATVDVMQRYIPNVELARLFGAASVVVCPYLDATQSGVVLTAYAFDVPVVGTAVGGLPEYIIDGETGVLVPPRDAAALANGLVRALKDTGLCDRVRRTRGRQFNWDRAAEETVETYAKAKSQPILRPPQGKRGNQLSV